MLTSSVLTALLWRGLDPPWQKQEGTILYYSSLLCSLCLFTSLQTQDRTFCWVSAHVPFHVTRLTARIIGLTGVYKTACFLCNESVQSVEETCVTSNKFSGKRVQHFFLFTTCVHLLEISSFALYNFLSNPCPEIW